MSPLWATASQASRSFRRFGSSSAARLSMAIANS